MAAASLPARDALLALAVVAIWGTNFVVIRLGLAHLPPLLFACLRFALAALPAALVLPRPRVAWGNLAAYGLSIGLGQFGLLFLAMRGHITPGLASLVIQVQAFFTIGLSMRLTGERVAGRQWLALGLAALGLGVIAGHADAATTPLGLALTIGAGLGWAGGNIAVKLSGARDMLGYVVWASLFSAPPLFALSLAFEGWDAIRAGLASADATTWAAVVWQAAGNVMFGYAAWGRLLARHPAARIAPLALLVPVFGMATAALALGEPLPPWKIAAAALVLGGLALQFLPRAPARPRAPTPPTG